MSEFVVTDLDLVIEPAARAAARRSLDSSGLLLLGEAHGVRENPLLIRALMKAFGLTSLALEWPDDLAPVIQAFLAGKTLADHPWLWGGDGRVPMGARLAGQRPGIREIRISYGAGSSWNFRPRQFTRPADPHGAIRLHQRDSKLVLDLPLATEAVVPQRPHPSPTAAGANH